MRRCTYVLIFLTLLNSISVHARTRHRKQSPKSANYETGCLRPTNYFVPENPTECASGDKELTLRLTSYPPPGTKAGDPITAKLCASFVKRSDMQGAGLFNHEGTTLQYIYGHRYRAVDPKCTTTVGSLENCIVPYISVAAGKKGYAVGDIIQVKDLEGAIINIPGGQKFRHPGYFVVSDRGAWIQGAGRFDFFTGMENYSDPKNPFGLHAPTNQIIKDATPENPGVVSLTDKNMRKCIKFERIKPESPERWSAAYKAILESTGIQMANPETVVFNGFKSMERAPGSN